MFVSSLTPEIGDKAEFSYSALRDIPEESGCYVLTTYDGTILYIGQSINVCRRIEQHLDKDDKRKKTPWGVAFWAYYALCPAIELDALEGGWVYQYRMREKGNLPFFNKVMPPA